MDPETRRQRISAKNRYNFVTAVLFLAKTWFAYFVVALLATVAVLLFSGLRHSVGLRVRNLRLRLRRVLGVAHRESESLGSARSSRRSRWRSTRYYWFHERHWHMFGLTQLAGGFAGTPFKNIFSRLEGVRMGKMVFDDGVRWTEYTLMEIGDYANLNALSILWPHSLEEGVFKSDHIKIGAGCTIHTGCLVHYGVTMGEHVVLEANSYLMKGEILDPYTTWRGNPAKEVVGGGAAGRGAGARAGLRSGQGRVRTKRILLTVGNHARPSEESDRGARHRQRRPPYRFPSAATRLPAVAAGAGAAPGREPRRGEGPT